MSWDAFGDLYREHYGELVAMLRKRFGVVPDSDDLIHEAYIRVQLASERQAISNVRGFLYRTAVNLAIDRRRADAARPASVDLDQLTNRAGVLDRDPAQVLVQVPASPEEAACTDEWLAGLARIVGELPPRCRHVFTLHKVEGQTLTEIANTLNISVSMVEQHMTKALSHVRRRLREDGLDG